MTSNEKRALNREKAIRLKKDWKVDAVQVRYSDTGHWYASLVHFPAALFDPNGYVLFASEAEYRSAPMSLGKQISVRKPGISAMPGYVRMGEAILPPNQGSTNRRYALLSDIEGLKTEARYFKRKRSRPLRDSVFGLACGICSVCEVDYSQILGGLGIRVLQVHHRKQLSSRDQPSVTKAEDLVVVCANCHMLLHLNQEEALGVDELRDMLARDEFKAGGVFHP